MCDANPKGGKGQWPAVAGLRLGKSWGETAMNGLVLFCYPQWAALHLSCRYVLRRRYGGSVCACVGVPSCRHVVCQAQHSNSGGIVWPVCLFCPSEEERFCPPFHLPSSPPDTHRFSFSKPFTCLTRSQGASTKGSVVVLGVPCQLGSHACHSWIWRGC